ncbi:MAG: restriction endonuclease subunit S [Candidatus Riflebacteria bacterium]|nr:restriction endonuclease subunit S [Candidatus Riflebacteria bacterium]
MTPGKLLAHFDRISDAPDAISRLRRFILDLAVRGKVVEQDPNDEPASELLKRIAAEKIHLVKVGKIRKLDSQRFLSNEDTRYAIPATWAWTRLGEIGDWGSGSTPPRGTHEYFGGEISWLKSGELNDKEALAGSEEKITTLALSKCSFRKNAPGDILFAMYGATIGKVAILTEHAVTNQAVVGCTPFHGVFNRYLFKFLQAQRAQFHLASEGGAQPNVSKEKVVRCSFPLPPLAEQHRIVAKVDELMALCDQLEAARAEREKTRDRLTAASLARLSATDSDSSTFSDHARFALDNLAAFTTRPDQVKQLRQTILSLAVRGKLVPQNPKDEPASELLRRIAIEKCGVQQQGRTKRCRNNGTEELVGGFLVPSSWCWTSLGAITLEMRYGTSKKCGYEKTGTPVLRIPNVSGGRIDLEDLKYGPLSKKEIEDLSLRCGDLLFIRSNGSLQIVGRATEVDKTAEGMSFAGYLVRARMSNENVFTGFISLVMSSEYLRDQIEKPIRSAVGLKNVNSTEFSSLIIPLPPLAEQHHIVAKVDELMALCDRLEVQLTTTRTESSRLLEAVLHEALAPALTNTI